MRNRNLSRIQRGFTLIEILVVVVILAVLAAVIVPNVLNRVGDARESTAISDISSFNNLLDSYKLDTGNYPESLDALVKNPGTPKWNGPYIKNSDKVPSDPWGNQYVYKMPGDNGREYDLASPGKDGQLGSADDVQSWNLKKE
jgi:general secretion pathway protein G